MKLVKLTKMTMILGLVTTLVACGGQNQSANSGNTGNAAANEGTNTTAEETTETTGTELGKINVITREPGSGTRGAFTEITGIFEKKDGTEVDNTSQEAAVQNSTNAVLTTVANDAASIGYISLGSLNDTVKALKVEGAEATAENIKSGDYKIARPFNVCYKEDIDEKTKDLLVFIESDEGQKIVEAEKYIPEEGKGDYEPIDNDAHITIAGSTSVTPLMEKIVEAYQKLNPKFVADIQATGSTAGVQSAIEGSAQLGMASRELKDEEAAQVKNDVIARDGIAVIVNKENPQEDMTLEQIKNVFVGSIADWTELK
ncbi:substrate-binding domain-containing protein [Peptoniphilus raoultii]|uniref:substrate-binding domain-containing protein n=1 Tax=Peptoniphilus raoultii TaxID=1776387 RepID=UPI0008DA125B|nr:substrate-binding domain-containing protein [Peptoniphilus raoultii]